MIYWTARNTSRRRWQFEDGHRTKERAEQAARFYRREFRRRCVVVAVPDGCSDDRRGDLLMDAVMSS